MYKIYSFLCFSHTSIKWFKKKKKIKEEMFDFQLTGYSTHVWVLLLA